MQISLQVDVAAETVTVIEDGKVVALQAKAHEDFFDALQMAVRRIGGTGLGKVYGELLHASTKSVRQAAKSMTAPFPPTIPGGPGLPPSGFKQTGKNAGLTEKDKLVPGLVGELGAGQSETTIASQTSRPSPKLARDVARYFGANESACD